MSPETAGIIVAALGALGALAQSWRATKAVNETTKVATETLEQAKVIHVAVNSNLTAVKADLVIANERIFELLVLLGKADPKAAKKEKGA